MPSPTLATRDRIAVASALAAVTVLSWIYLVGMARSMASMPMDPAAMDPAVLTIRPWTGGYFVMMFLMWTIMMIGMMLPTVTPMALVYAAVARKAAREGSPLAPTAVFVSGYVVVWTLFSLCATGAQWALDQAALLSPMMVATSPGLGAALLIGAGAYQWTPAKNACLRQCRSPAYFISENWCDGATGAFRMGVHHGVFCLGCCWVLMGLLFFGGVMDLVWIAGITLFVLLEKLAPFGASGGRWAGGAMIAIGVWMLRRWFAG